MTFAAVFKTQMSPFDQMRLVKRITKGTHPSGVCSGFCLLWLKQKLADRMALSSMRVAYLRDHLEEAGELQTKRDNIKVEKVEQQSNEPTRLINFFAAEDIELYGWWPTNGLVSLGDKKKFQDFVKALESLRQSYPAYFIFSLLLFTGGLHMLAGEMAMDGIRIFDPNYGEFWSPEPKGVLDGLYDLYQKEDKLMTNAQLLLVRASRPTSDARQ